MSEFDSGGKDGAEGKRATGLNPRTEPDVPVAVPSRRRPADAMRAQRASAAAQISRSLKAWRTRELDGAANEAPAPQPSTENENDASSSAESASGEKAEGAALEEGEAQDETISRKVFLARPPSLDRQMPDPARVEQSRAQWGEHFAGQQQAQQQQGGIAAAPEALAAFPDARRAPSKTGVQGGGGLRRRWKDGSGNIYEWDSQHGTVEKYDGRGKHLGEFNPTTGAQTKPADKNRSVDP